MSSPQDSSRILDKDLGTPSIEDDTEPRPYKNRGVRRVNIQPYDYSVRSLMDMVVDGDLILNPDYQRKYRWDDAKASRFIESLILNIPVPVVYLSEEADTRYTIIDGQQRLVSLLRFTRPEEAEILFKQQNIKPLNLSGLQVREDLNDKSFRELEIIDRNSLQKRHVRCICILNESDSALKYEVFERLNTGSIKLTPQEIRNCIYRGSFNDLLSETSKNKQFQDLIKLPEKDKHNMKDMELVLRFYAYRDFASDYNDNLNEYLNEYMEQNRVISDARKYDLLKIFNETIELIYKILGPGIAFRKPYDRENPNDGRWYKNQINAAIYDSQMINYSLLPSSDKLSDTLIESIREATFSVFSNDKYWNAISYGTSLKGRVKTRVEKLYEYLSELEIPISSLKETIKR